MTAPFSSLADASARIVATADLDEKVEIAFAAAKAWFGRRLSLRGAEDRPMPDRPGRPERPLLVPPRDLPKSSLVSRQGRIALIHSLAHIELNAVDLTWDLVGRFVRVPMPRSFFDNWVQVGLEEAKHFSLLADHLKTKLDAAYGDMPAHDGLWQATQETGHDLMARLAVLPLVLEARGLDVTPPLVERLAEHGDEDGAGILRIIYRDERRHVAFGCKWFRFLCDRHHLAPEPTFRKLVIKHFRGPLKPPFNDMARAEAGMTPGFYRPLVRPPVD